jgi:histidinol-phosphate aminotransferase
MRSAIGASTRVVFVANPNNPTGSWVPPAVLRAFIESVPRDVIVVVDEAYDEYLAASDQAQSARWLDSAPNLVISRTFSKAYGLAGLRIGYGLMNRGVADLLNRVRQPFNVNAIAQTAAIAALADRAYVQESAELNRRGLDELAAGARRLGVEAVPSHGNFLLLRVGDAARVYESLLRQAVIVRPVANYGLPEYLRVTTGLPEENARFLAALAVALKPS